MERKKIMLILLILAALSGVVFLVWSKQKISNKTSLPDKTELSKPTGFIRQFSGKVQAVENNQLTMENEKSPLKKMLPAGENPTHTVELTENTAVFLAKKGGGQEKKTIEAIRLADNVVVEYNLMTKAASSVTIFEK